jgi:ribosome maturation factor RimP
MYNRIVERSEWAKAHFFIAIDEMSVIANEEIAARISEIAERVATPEAIEIVEVQLLGSGRGRVLRIFIDRPQGVSHADCEFISQQVGTILDVEDVIPGDSYTLEVSSPGLERKLQKAKDFERFVGKKAKVVLREPVENQRRWEGKLAGFSDGMVALEPSTGKVIRFPLAQVEKANLKFEW